MTWQTTRSALDSIETKWNTVRKAKYEYETDLLGRITQQRLRGALATESRFVYDGWNIVAELDASKVTGSNYANCLKQAHAWGLDVSGSTQGAGGIGGLLFTRYSGYDYFPIYDGRGNLTGMINESGNIVAGYQYSTFGNRTASVGSMKDDFKFGWSTKFTDGSTKLINFGKRWYDSDHGRFINRDPIGERGGINLYAFLTNNPLGGYEYLGMGFFSKLFDKIGSFFKGIVKAFKDVVIQAALGWIPFVGPFLAAAYGAYQGYKKGGILGGITGFMGGFKVGKAMQEAGSSIGDAFKAGWSKISEMATVGSFVVQEAMGALVKAVDRKIRGFGKWFGQAMSAYSIATGFSEFQKSFSESVAALGRAVISGSAQLSRVIASGGSGGSGSRMRVDLLSFDFDTESSLSKVLKDMLAPLKSALSPEWMAMELKWAAQREASNHSIREAEAINAAVARSTYGPKYTAADSARAYIGGLGARRTQAYDHASRYGAIVGNGAMVVGGVIVASSGVGTPLGAAMIAKGTIDMHLNVAGLIDHYQTGGQRNIPTGLFNAIGGVHSETGAYVGAAADALLSLRAPGKLPGRIGGGVSASLNMQSRFDAAVNTVSAVQEGF